jgi:hypothetical protein
METLDLCGQKPIKLANSQHTSLLVHLAHVGLNKFEKCKDANCIWRTFDPMTKNCCVKIDADDLHSPEFIRLGILKNMPKPDRQARLIKLTPFGASLHPSAIVNSFETLSHPNPTAENNTYNAIVLMDTDAPTITTYI